MNAEQILKSESGIEQQIRSIRMSEGQRNQVLHQARVAEAFVNAIVRACKACTLAGAEALMRPGAYYRD